VDVPSFLGGVKKKKKKKGKKFEDQKRRLSTVERKGGKGERSHAQEQISLHRSGWSYGEKEAITWGSV